MYHSAFTARDRDRLRQQVLEGLGWKIHRIWSRDWIQNREAEIDKVLNAISVQKKDLSIQRISNKKKRNNPVLEEPSAANSDLNKITDSPNNHITPPGAVPYERRMLRKQVSTGGDAILNTPVNRIADALVAIVNAEGPISIDVAKQRVVEAWATRKGKRISDYLDSAIAFAKRNKYLEVKGYFLWPVGMTTPPLRIHTNGHDMRSVLVIPPEEIEIAIRECVKSAIGITLDDLIRETCRLFGLNATTENTAQVSKIIETLVLNSALVSRNNKLTKGKNF